MPHRPLSVFRRNGFRTQSEIEPERYALKAIRGDFEVARKQQDGYVYFKP